MIVKMKKITLLCVENERAVAMEQLRELGIVHVDHESKVESDNVAAMEETLSGVSKAVNILSGLKCRKKVQAGPEISGRDLYRRASELLDRQESLEKELDALGREIERLRPWGDFDPEQVEDLAREGVRILFCRSYREEYDALAVPENAAKVLIRRNGKEMYFLMVFQGEPDGAEYPVIALPQARLSELESKAETLQDELRKVGDELAELSLKTDVLRKYFADLQVEYEFLTNRDGMVTDGAIAYLTGYIPADQLPLLTEAAHRNGWAITADDPAPDDARVPTCIRKPGWVKIIDPLFDFVGITPGYRENDVSVFFLIAFPIFFGMLICDSAYGTLFLVTALLGKFLLRKKPAAQMPLNLLILLSSFSIAFGLLTGACLGLPRSVLPVWLGGLDFLAEPEKSPAALKLAERLSVDPADLTNKYTQWFCFLLAALHLSAAHLFKYLTDIRNWRSWGNIGWACVIWGNFFTAVNLIVFPGTFPRVAGFTLYGVGVLLILITITGEAVMTLPSTLVGSFVDVLSYIRLFAVGLSGMYVASCFNSMGRMMLDSLPKECFVIGLIGMIVVAVAGHLLNILLGFMGVLVHALRLNTLEFSNHAEMAWTGRAYRPFAKKQEEKNE
ncbi:MAG: hypothetical protein IJS14_05890 [Lentisphaeria bacterium]|nr:hypothetical protein [Lentisphaeria bacterium]